jgi:hypothetical protein
MDNFKIIYKILKALEKALEAEEFDPAVISPEALKITQAHWNSLLAIILEEGYVNGAVILPVLGSAPSVKVTTNTRITIRGMEYLQENSMMKKAANIAKGIVDLIP